MNEPEIPDPYCNPDKPVAITFDEITSAAYRIKSGIKNTECSKSEHLTNLTGMEIYIKKEFLQPTGSFKERGARYCMMRMSPEMKSKGIVAASAGNHAQACCYHGLLLGVPVTVVMPDTAPIMKIEKCKNYKGNVLVQGKNLTESKRIALAYARDHGMMYLNGYDHPEVLAGQGTIGLEIWEQVPGLEAVIVPVGGGGLLAGICVAIKALDRNIKVIGVEPERAACLTEALRIGKPVEIKLESTLADGLAVAKIGVNSFASVKNILDKCVTVKEQYVALGILRLVEYEKCVVEGAGASPLAAILQGLVPELKGKKVCLILSGGNIDTTVLGRALDRGLAADGRLVKVKVCISDRVGGLEELTNTIGSLGVHIKDMVHERAWVIEDVFKVEVKVICECRDRAHSLHLKEVLANKYGSIFFNGQLYPDDDLSRPTAIFAGVPPQQHPMREKPSEIGQESIQQNVTEYEDISKKEYPTGGTPKVSAHIATRSSLPSTQQVSVSFPPPQAGAQSPYLQPDVSFQPVSSQGPQQPQQQFGGEACEPCNSEQMAGSVHPSCEPCVSAQVSVGGQSSQPVGGQPPQQVGEQHSEQVGERHPQQVGGQPLQQVEDSFVPSHMAPLQTPHLEQHPSVVDQKFSQAGSQIGSSHPSQQAAAHVGQYPSTAPPLGDQKASHTGTQIGSSHPSKHSAKNDIGLMKPFSNCACKKRNAPGDYQK